MSSANTGAMNDKNNEKSALVPRLRFSEFLEAEGWIAKSLKNACEVNPSNSELPEKFVYIDLESVEAGELKARRTINRDEAPSRAQRLLRFGDVIFQIVRPYQRNNLHFKIDEKVPYVASTGYAQLRAKDSAGFLFQAVHSDDFVGRVIGKCTGSSYPAINSSDLADISLAIPGTAEQQKIADCLSSLDELITAETQKLDVLKTHKKGLMQQLFPREGETVPRLRFPEFRGKEGWEEHPVSGMLEETLRPLEMNNDEGYTLVTVKRRYGGIVLREVLKGRDILVKSQFRIKTHDFLISKRQIVHCACGVVPEAYDGAIVSNEYTILQARKNCDIGFFNYFSQQPIVGRSFLECSVGIVIEKMLFKQDQWLKKKFLFPRLPEQQRIAECLSSLDELITAQSQKIDALKTHKKGMMQQLFPVLDEAQA